jgi:hypothetical protein
MKLSNERRKTYNPNTQSIIVWSIEDVQQQNNGLTDAQAMHVLRVMRNRHDACIGIS